MSIRKWRVVILSEAKNLCGSSNYEILRRPAAGGTPQNDTHKRGFRMDTNKKPHLPGLPGARGKKNNSNSSPNVSSRRGVTATMDMTVLPG